MKKTIAMAVAVSVALATSGCMGQALYPERDQAGYERGDLDLPTLLLDILTAPFTLPILLGLLLPFGGHVVVVKEFTNGIWKAKHRDYGREAREAVKARPPNPRPRLRSGN